VVGALGARRRLRTSASADVAEAWEQLGDVRERIGAFTEGVEAYRTARRLRSGDTVAQALLYLKQARAYDRLGDYSQYLRWTRRGLTLLEDSRDPEAAAARAQLETFYAIGKQNQGRAREAVAWCRRAIADAEAAGSERTLAHALFVLDWALVTLGRIDEATNSARALAIYEALDDLSGQSVVANGMGAFAFWQGRWDDATALYERSREIRERLGDPVTAADGTYNIAEILVDQGRFDEAEAMLADVLRTWRAADARGRVADATRLLGRIASRTGRPEEGLRLLEDARAVYQELGAQGELAETEARIAGSLVRAGLAEEGLARADEARTHASEIHVPLIERIRGYALLQLGELDGAREAFEDSLASARAQDADFEVAMTLDAFVRLDLPGHGEPDAGVEAERDEILRRLGVVQVPEFPPATPRARTRQATG
jgi:tetratricopeptide (TPR) repeat protein